MADVIQKLWPGETVAILASGPSLCAEDIAQVRGRARVMVVNSTWRMAPWADALYAADTEWWTGPDGKDALQAFNGLKVTVSRKFKDDTVVSLKSTGDYGLELDPSGLRTGRNSGYMAMNLAVHLGATRILLLGYDMQLGPKGERHCHKDHRHERTLPFPLFLGHFASIVEPLRSAGVEVVNCTRRTALSCFPRMDVREALLERVA